MKIYKQNISINGVIVKENGSPISEEECESITDKILEIIVDEQCSFGGGFAHVDDGDLEELHIREARWVLKESGAILLSKEDGEILFNALFNPAPASEKLKAAAKKYLSEKQIEEIKNLHKK